MNQLCRVCGEPAAGFHFGAFTCEGCKSFFGRTYNNLSSISECKNGGQCVINKKNRTSCKACRLRKCLVVGMSKSGSRYGRRSNWFKIHCLLQEQSNNNNNNNNTTSQHLLDTKIMKNNENSSWNKKIRSESPPSSRSIALPNYGGNENASSLAAAAAAFWASRGTTLLPHLPTPDLSSPQVPLSPFLASPFTNRNFLFPYLSPVPTTLPTNKSSTPVDSRLLSPNPSSNSSSSSSSCCSSPNEKIPRIFENKKDDAALSGLALLRTLGPVQEAPMDLSVKSGVKNELSDNDEDELDHDKNIASRSGSIKNEGTAVDSDSGCKMEHPGKPVTPLDLTTKL